jgi:RNA polymerase sigma-70 factor (ECF subfamily)
MDQAETELLYSLAHDLHGHFIQVVQRYQQRLYVFACRLAGSQEAEDILQEAFVSAYVSLENYGPERIRSLKLQAWLYRIVLNVYSHHARAARLHLVPLTPFAESDEYPLEDCPEERPEALFEQREQLTALEECVARLPESHRVAVTCYYFESLSYQEIAELLDQPLGTVKSNIYRGVRRLRATLKAEEQAGREYNSWNTRKPIDRQA